MGGRVDLVRWLASGEQRPTAQVRRFVAAAQLVDEGSGPDMLVNVASTSRVSHVRELLLAASRSLNRFTVAFHQIECETPVSTSRYAGRRARAVETGHTARR